MSKIELPTVSIIIINLNGKKWLKICLETVLKNRYPEFEIILVDNGSTDGSVEYVKRQFSQFKKIKIIQNKRNLGWSPANNIGAKAARGEILVFLSNDMEVPQNWLLELIKVFKLEKKIGAVQCNSISMWDKKTLDSSMNYLDRFGFSYGYRPAKKPTEVFFAEGMAFAIKKEIFKIIDGFDKDYFMEYDDMDLCWRTRLAGFKIYFAPHSLVYHARGGTVGTTYFDRIPNVTWYVRNHFTTLIKNFGILNLFITLPLVLLAQMAKIIYFSSKGNWPLVKATGKGIWEVIKNIEKIIKKRKKVQKLIRKVSDKEIKDMMHPFRPKLLYQYIVSQSQGKRFILNFKPPLKEVYIEKN